MGYGALVSLGHAVCTGIGGYVVGILAFQSYESLPQFNWPFILSGIENGLLAWPSLLLAFRSSLDVGNNLAVLSCVFKKAVKDVCS